jgi:hypothetical protein
MAKTSDQAAGKTAAEKPGALPGFLAEENEFDRRSLFRIGTWGALALAAVVLAVISNQSSLGWHREELAANDLARQTQQIQQLTKESQNETRRLASAIDTLNNDRDRLYSRVTVLEQGLDSVTGAIAKQNTPPPAAATSAPAPIATEPSAAPPAPTNLGAIPQPKAQALPPTPQPNPPQKQNPPPAVAPAASAPAPVSPVPEKPRVEVAAKSDPTPAPSPAQFASNASALAAGSPPPPPPKSMMGPPDPAAPKLIEAPKPVASAAPAAAQAALQAVAPAPAKDQEVPEAAPGDVPVNHTDFAVDLGSANSVGGLRALWRGLVKSDPALAELHPIIVVKEGTTGLGMQLRLAAGPLHDAAAAAKICAALMENKRACETTVFDGQHLAMAVDDAKPAEKPPTEAKPASNSYRHSYYYPKHLKKDEPPPKPEPSTLSSLFGAGKK